MAGTPQHVREGSNFITGTRHYGILCGAHRQFFCSCRAMMNHLYRLYQPYILLRHLCRPYFEGSSCQPPISPYGSTIVYPAQRGNHKNGSVVVFGCKQGLYLTGLPIIKCNGNTWTAVNFKCLLSKNCFLFLSSNDANS